MPWYEGTSLLHHLEEVHIALRPQPDRLPVPGAVRDPPARRRVTTTTAATRVRSPSGVLKPGDEVVVLPSGFTSTIASIETADGPVDEAFPPMSVTIRLADDLDVARGDMICRPNNQPQVGQDVDAMVCWMSATAPLTPGAKYAIKHTTQLGPRTGRRICSTGST